MSSNQEEKLRQEILEDARQKADRLVAKAKVGADRIIAEARAAAEQRRTERLAQAEEEAKRECASILLEVRRETRRHWLLEREKCIDALMAKALAEAEGASEDERRRSFELLAREAIAAMGMKDMRVSFAEADKSLVTRSWLEEIAHSVLDGNTPAFELAPSRDAKPGLLFESLDGTRTYDNTYASRLDRMRDDLAKEFAG